MAGASVSSNLYHMPSRGTSAAAGLHVYYRRLTEFAVAVTGNANADDRSAVFEELRALHILVIGELMQLTTGTPEPKTTNSARRPASTFSTISSPPANGLVLRR